MRLAVFYEHIFEAAQQRNISVKEVLRHAKACGISCLECDLWRLSDRAAVKELFDSCGMGVSSIYSHFDFINDSAEGCAEKYSVLLDTAEYFGAEKVLCIPGFFDPERDRKAQLDRVAQRLSEMCDAASQRGITVTLEDFDDISSPCCRMADLRYLMDRVPPLRCTFDTGNFRYCLESAQEALTLLRDRVAHVHCKDRSYDKANADPSDSNGKADLSGAVMYPAPVCGGVIGIAELVTQLIRSGYDGIFAIEHFGAADQWEYMRISAERLLELREV